LKVKIKGQGHQRQKRHFSALSAVCVRFMFGKTSLVSIQSLLKVRIINRTIKALQLVYPSVCSSFFCYLWASEFGLPELIKSQKLQICLKCRSYWRALLAILNK